jgi:RimJ/RimL family protein N-acetyltransferase
MDLTIRPATTQDLEEARRWLQRDAGMLHLGNSFNPSRQALDLRHVASCWVAERSGEVVALASLVEDRANQATIGFVVKPEHRRQGIAKTFVPMLLERPEAKKFSKIIGTPRFEEVAFQKTLRRAGFYQTGHDQNGLIVYERR